MKPSSFLRYPYLRRLTSAGAGLCLSALLAATQGCAQFGEVPSLAVSAANSLHAQADPAAGEMASPVVIRAQKQGADAGHLTQLPAVSEPVLLSLDTVFRLAEDQNPLIAQARERVEESLAEKDLASSRWLPDLYVGTAYYRHEGGIQNEDGRLTHSSMGSLFAGLEMGGHLDIREVAYQKVNAQRKFWQQKGDLSKVTSDTLLDASNTYIDLLTAKSGEMIARDLEKNLRNLLDRAEKLASTEPGARVEVSRIQAEVNAERLTVVKLHNQAAGASAKLVYLLGLDPAAEIAPVDKHLMTLDLVDARPPASDLVAQVLASGPGIQEMESLLSVIQDAMDRSQGPSKYAPILEMRMAEGGYGAGPGDRMDWDNRWDLGLQARWNLTECLTQRDRQRAAQAKVQQAHLAYQDLRAKLTAGVQEARETIVSGKEQMGIAESQVREAVTAFQLTDARLKEALQPTSFTEALLAIGAVGRAKQNFLTALNAYDKAQLRLLVLLGQASGHHGR
jgi:multidrug efflux system outer membrane protein